MTWKLFDGNSKVFFATDLSGIEKKKILHIILRLFYFWQADIPVFNAEVCTVEYKFHVNDLCYMIMQSSSSMMKVRIHILV